MPRTKTGDQQIKVILHKFAHMLPGQSFFMADCTRADVEFIRRPAQAMGLGITIVQVEVDEIYQQPGVRIWREEGEFDEL